MFEVFLITFINNLAPTALTANTTVELFGVAEYNLANTRLTFTVEGGCKQYIPPGRSGRPQEVALRHMQSSPFLLALSEVKKAELKISLMGSFLPLWKHSTSGSGAFA